MVQHNTQLYLIGVKLTVNIALALWHQGVHWGYSLVKNGVKHIAESHLLLSVGSIILN